MKRWRGAALFAVMLAVRGIAGAQLPPRIDFTRAGGEAGWEASHDVAPLTRTDEGLVIKITGADPFITSPARDYPESEPLSLVLRAKSDEGGVAQVFYFQGGAQEAKSVRFVLRKGVWEDVRVKLPPLGARYRLRFDPPGATGTCILASLAVEAQPKEAPAAAAPAPR